MSDSKWDLGRLNAGELSALRRAAGTAASKANMTALRAFYAACGYCDPWKEAYWFPAMCMDALWRDTEAMVVKPMDECLRGLLTGDSNTTASLKRRIDMLLETPWNEDGFLIGKMLNLVKILKSKTNLKPDFQLLADDLMRWNDEGRKIQRRWLKTLYNVKPMDDEEETQNVD